MSLIIYKKSNVTVITKEGTTYQGRVTATIDPTNETVSYQINEGVILTEAWSQTFKEDGSTPIGATLADVIAYNGANLVFNTASGGSEVFSYKDGFSFVDNMISDNEFFTTIKVGGAIIDVTDRPIRVYYGDANDPWVYHTTQSELFLFQTNKRIYECMLYVPNHNDSNTLIFGYSNSPQSYDIGVYFLIDKGQNFIPGTLNNNILCVCKNYEGQSVYDTGISLSSIASLGGSMVPMKFGIECDDIAKKVTYKINGAIVHEITNSYYPIDLRLPCLESIYDNNSSAMWINYSRFEETFGTPRP